MSEKDIFDLSDLSNITPINIDKHKFYEKKFALKWNPFPEVGVPTSDISGYARIRDKEIKKILGAIRSAVVPPYKRQAIIIQGAYGSGKSFILKKIVSSINKSQSAKADEAIMAVYVPRPSFEAHALNRAILENLGFDTIRKITWQVIRGELAIDRDESSPNLKNLWIQLLESRSKKGFSPIQLSFIDHRELPVSIKDAFNPDRFDDYRKFLEVFDKQGWNRSLLQKYLSELLSRGLKTISPASVPDAFIKLLLASNDKSAWDELLELDLHRKGDRTDFVLRFLRDLLSLLKADGYIYLFVAVDEFEQATMKQILTARQQSDYAYTLLEIITNVENNFGLILAITPEGYNSLQNVVPLGDRLTNTIVELEPLSNADIVSLMEFYLDVARSAKRSPQHLFPFSPEVIKKIEIELRTIGLGLQPRNVLQFLHFALEYHFDNSIALINEESINKCLALFKRMVVQHRSQGKLR